MFFSFFFLLPKVTAEQFYIMVSSGTSCFKDPCYSVTDVHIFSSAAFVAYPHLQSENDKFHTASDKCRRNPGTRLAQQPHILHWHCLEQLVPSHFSATYCVYQTSYTTHVPTYLFSKYCLVLTCSSLSVSVVYQKVVANSHKLCCFKQVTECRCLYNHPLFVFTIKEVLKQLYF